MDWWVWLIIGFVVLGVMGKVEEDKKKAAILKRIKEGEDYIMRSGDPQAIKMLMLARANPNNYSKILSGGMNKGSGTLKTALGVMTGVVAGNLIATAITASAIQSALESMQADISSLDLGSLNDSQLVDADLDDIDFS